MGRSKDNYNEKTKKDLTNKFLKLIDRGQLIHIEEMASNPNLVNVKLKFLLDFYEFLKSPDSLGYEITITTQLAEVIKTWIDEVQKNSKLNLSDDEKQSLTFFKHTLEGKSYPRNKVPRNWHNNKPQFKVNICDCEENIAPQEIIEDDSYDEHKEPEPETEPKPSKNTRKKSKNCDYLN